MQLRALEIFVAIGLFAILGASYTVCLARFAGGLV